MIVRTLNIILAALVSFWLVSPVQAERAFYSAFSLVPGATALGDLVFTLSTGGVIRTDTVDGTDNKQIIINGGGGAASNRGAQISALGNEVAAVGGSIFLQSGNISSGSIFARFTNASSIFGIRNVSDGLMWSFNNSGDLTQDATNGGNIVFSRTNTGVRNTVAAAVTAAGTTSTDATVITSGINNVTTAAVGSGVRAQSFPVGMTIIIRNQTANAFNIYPPTGGNILGYGTDVGASLAVNAMAICYVQTSLLLGCSEAPNL